jgi:catechol 2,3-dioxygenase-like lactoylglutathione lyase family enzyme
LPSKDLPMFSHVFVSVKDFDRAFRFYSEIMQALGNELRFHDASKPWAGWHSEGKARPLFVICHPFDGGPHEAGNGQMIAFMAQTRAKVNSIHAIALELGGQNEGSPGLRPHYHPDYYGAYFRDPDGNKVCVVCHSAG